MVYTLDLGSNAFGIESSNLSTCTKYSGRDESGYRLALDARIRRFESYRPDQITARYASGQSKWVHAPLPNGFRSSNLLCATKILESNLQGELMSVKKKEQLGMNPSTASHRLVKDLLWSYIVKCGDNLCHHCGEALSRDDFSIEHIEPWLDSEDPFRLFFDLGNISYSHRSCNYSAARKTRASCGSNSAYRAGCRCDLCKKAHAAHVRKYYTPASRRDKYLKTGH